MRRLSLLFAVAVIALLAWTGCSRDRQRSQRGRSRFALAIPHVTPPRVLSPPPNRMPSATDTTRVARTTPPATARVVTRGPSPIDQPMARSWPAVNTWSPTIEHEYADFVAGLGRAISEHRCRQLDGCLRDPSANTLFDPATDAHLNLNVDCADLPYVLRAYFAFKRRLPFGFVSEIRGDAGRDPRYTLNVRPSGFMTWQRFATPHDLLRDIGSLVHSGMYRTAPTVEDSDFYEIAINRRALHPGTIFYDPNGHVLVVTEVRADGQVYLMDGHPDGTLTFKRFGEAFVTGTARLGGGFKDFRPQLWREGRIVRAPNVDLAAFDGRAQFDRTAYTANGTPSTYHAWVRASLRDGNAVIDPVDEFREQVRALCRDVTDRVDAVNIAFASGIAAQAHPGSLPENIYGTDGDWEAYSTPSRDARLKASFRELFNFVALHPDRVALAGAFESAWHDEVARPECQFQYTRSNGVVTPFTLDTVLDRIYKISFDPYQCAELRWGATEGTDEFSTCRDDRDRLQWYVDEQRLRNRIDREYGVPTPLGSGPVGAADLDVRRLLARLPAGA